jgi:alkylation response protein AidB-like acyl-CoA dehydrogenase
MDFSLTGEQIGFQQQVRSLARAVCSPGAAERDATGAFPRQELQRLGEEGLLGLRVPRELGGSPRDSLSSVLAIAAVSEADASVGLLLGFHNLVVCEAIREAASSECREKLLPELAGGAHLGALALYDAQTSGETFVPAAALAEAGGFRIDGEKPLVPGARGAGGFLLYARGASEAGRRTKRPRIVLYVPRSLAGVEVDEPSRIFGVRASGACRVRFAGCRVEGSMRLFADDDGRGAARALLSAADLVVAAQAVGIATAAFEKATARALEKPGGGESVSGRQSVQWKLADMGTFLEAATLLLLRAASAQERGDPYAYEAAQAKAFAGRAAVRVAENAMLITGALGAITDFGVERHWRDAMTTEMNPSTRDETLLAVARALLEGPR